MQLTNFNDSIRWSRLARFGKSSLARLTIVTPFLGFLIFLNVGLEEYVSLGPLDLVDGLLKYLAERRIEILYLGLLMIGGSTALFTLIAPDAIKSSDQYSDHIQFKEDTKTQNSVRGSLESSLENCVSRYDINEKSFHEFEHTNDFPEVLTDSILRLIPAIYEVIDDGNDELTQEDQEAKFEVEQSFYMYNGMIDIDMVLECVTLRRRVEYGIWKAFFNVAPEFSIDVFRLEYLIKDYSFPRLRLLVFLLFSFGSLVALIPTLVSAILVLAYSF